MVSLALVLYAHCARQAQWACVCECFCVCVCVSIHMRVGTRGAGRAGGALDDAGGEGVAFQRRREAALTLVTLITLEASLYLLLILFHALSVSYMITKVPRFRLASSVSIRRRTLSPAGPSDPGGPTRPGGPTGPTGPGGPEGPGGPARPSWPGRPSAPCGPGVPGGPGSPGSP